ncbi:MAG: serine/threonine-protein kinase [Polyangiaceae bacterium]
MYPQVFGKYVLERELARGGMARVLLATLRGAGGFEKKLVVKQIRDELALDTDFVRRFVEEAKTTVSLSHPNIVPVYELGVEQGTYFLAMELVEGASLAEIIEGDDKSEKIPLTPAQGAYVGIEICRALDYAHRRMQVVHRDITPRNVMVDDEGPIKLIDFGIAARAELGGADERERVFGSPGHMPPERIEGASSARRPISCGGRALDGALERSRPSGARRPRSATRRCTACTPSRATSTCASSRSTTSSRSAWRCRSKRPETADDLGRVLRRFLADEDIGDVARSLGDRAREARERAARRAEATTTALVRKREPSQAEMVTRTFAAREELVGAEPDAPSTRKLGSERPPPSSDGRVETIATRPLETPMREFQPAAAPDAPAKKRSNLPVVVGAGVVAVLVAALGLRARPRETDPRPTTVATATTNETHPTTSSVTASPPATTRAAPDPTASGHVPVKHAPSNEPATTAAVSATAEPPAERAPARFSIYCDPGTRVTIDGAARGGCPIRDLAVEPGPHDVRFVFEPTGESRGERVHAPSGAKITLRADFTGESPTVRVER